MRGQRWRQALYLQRDERSRAAGRRGHHPRAVLGELPGHREVCTRNARVRRNASGRRLQREGSGHRKSHHAKNKTPDSQFAEQSNGRRRASGRIRTHPRGLQEAQRLADGRRMLFALHLRPAQAVLDCQRGGFERKRDHYWLSFENVCDDWPEALIQALVKLQSQSTSNATSIAQYAALEAMRGSMDSVPLMLAEYAKRRKRIVEGLRAIPGITCGWPGGAFYAFPNISAHLSNHAGKPALAKSCTEITKMLLDKVQVAVVPGEAFGAPGYLRLSYATSIERIEEGLRRIERFFARAEAAS